MRTLTLALSVPVMFALAGCDDRGKRSEEKAVAVVDKLAPVVKDSAEQVRRGMPAGAEKLGKFVESDPGANLVQLQLAIKASRASVPDLDRAKSTFFSFADTSGMVLRSEADPDLLAGRSVFASFPSLKAAADGATGVIEAYGEMQEMRGVRNGQDHQWVVAHPVKDPAGAVKGVFVTGWSFRQFAFFLEEAAKRELFEAAQQESKKVVPLVYVFALKAGKAYGAPVTPDVNAEAVEKLDLISKTSAGPFRGTVEIAGRTFGVAARRTPELGEDAALAVILSVL